MITKMITKEADLLLRSPRKVKCKVEEEMVESMDDDEDMGNEGEKDSYTEN